MNVLMRSGSSSATEQAIRIDVALDVDESTTSETQLGPHAMLTCCAAATYVALRGCVSFDAYER